MITWITYFYEALPKAKSFWWSAWFLSVITVAYVAISTAAKF